MPPTSPAPHSPSLRRAAMRLAPAGSLPAAHDPDEDKGDDKLYTLQGNPWHRKEITYQVTRYPSRHRPEGVDAAIAKAFGYWQGALPDVTFVPVPDNAGGVQADIAIRFVDPADPASDFHFDPANPVEQTSQASEGLIIAHSFYPLAENGTLAGNIYFNAALDEGRWWALVADGDAAPGAIDLVTVAVHEIGHALGLGHSEVDASLMYPYYLGPRAALHAHDIEQAQAIYVRGRTFQLRGRAADRGGGGEPKVKVSKTSG